ncbi:MAG: tyrosine-type recombinase/integrase [Beijerinckiaceae bacterium]|nr:tyrosine-type recombinase/integrase [Beijerinckiaceae bacterium]
MSMITHARRHIVLKRGLGYSFVDQERVLLKYAGFAETAGDDWITTDRVLSWAATAPTAARARTWLSTVRNFAIAMHAEDDRHEIPPAEAFGRNVKRRPPPHILSVEDIRSLLYATRRLPPVASITPHTWRCMFGLMATTGLRVSEATKLHDRDATPEALISRETKFRKTRLVPIDATTQAAIDDYRVLRRLIGGPDPHLFVLSTGQPSDPATASRAFIRACRLIGLRPARGRGPRLHDLRHSFAVRSLERCGGDRAAIDRHMLALSTYLGHASVTDTYWYPEATPVLFRQIADASESFAREPRS